jgi:hypothetical protein
LAAPAPAVSSDVRRKSGARIANRESRTRFPQFARFAFFSPLFSSVASAISFGIAAKKMRKNPTGATCEKAVENLWISFEKGVQNAVDFLRVSGGLAAD